MGPGTLNEVLAKLPVFEHPDLLISGSKLDDAGVFRLSEELALVQTVDFFTPMVDDPYIFGQIAAANALSDIYAMGAVPLTAMNITAFPTCSLDLAILGEILAGGADKVLEAGAVLVGGHTIEDKEPKYGLAVTGTVHPQRVVSNAGARPGDGLVLTKPLGSGIACTAIKAGLAPAELVDAVINTMTALNRKAAEVMARVGVHAATDITGFGFLGHAYEICAASGVGMSIQLAMVPVIPGVWPAAAMGLVPGGARRNLAYLADKVEWQGEVSAVDRDILADPQTSGGLLMAVPAGNLEQVVSELAESGVPAAVVGEVTGRSGVIEVGGRSGGK